jgi:hypothetical protein
VGRFGDVNTAAFSGAMLVSGNDALDISAAFVALMKCIIECELELV